MNIRKLIVFLFFPLVCSIKPEKNVDNIYISEIINGTNKNSNGLNNLLNQIAGDIHEYEQGFKQHSINNQLNSINSTVSEEVKKGLLGYVNKHTLSDFRSQRNQENIVMEFGNHSNLEIDYNVTATNNTENQFGVTSSSLVNATDDIIRA